MKWQDNCTNSWHGVDDAGGCARGCLDVFVMIVSSRPEDFHLRALPEPYVNLSIHTAPDVRPLPWHSCQ